MNGGPQVVWLWESAHACGVTDNRERAMLRAEEHLDAGAVALVERAVVADSPRGGVLHIRTGMSLTGRRAGEGAVQWAETIAAEMASS